MKFCKDCRHYDGLTDNPFPVCRKSHEDDLVSGEVRFRTCLETRTQIDLCGKDASWFEPKVQ